MLTEKDKGELLKKLSDKKREVALLRNDLNSLNDKKEDLFRKKDELGRKIHTLIGQVKGTRNERNSFTKEVKISKERRKEVNDIIRKKIDEVKKLNKEKDDVIKKYNIKGDPFRISSEIDMLEEKIITDAMGFEKEKKVMVRIKELKRQYQEAKLVSGIFDSIRKVSKEIDNLREEAEGAHRTVQKKAHDSQDRHEEAVSISKDIEDTKKGEEEAFSKFVESKNRFNEVNENLKKALLELNEMQLKANEFRVDERSKREKSREEKLNEKKLSIEEKIKKGEKLTTADLIAFQAGR